MRLQPSFQLDADVRMAVADFRCGEDALAATLFAPAQPAELSELNELGVVIVVGGPQYRVGAHRQFVSIARHAAAAGYPALIFDHRGLGDSEGAPRRYSEIGGDIAAAVDRLVQLEPRVRHVALWSLCDGATASALYARHDPRVAGLILVNPWLEPTRSHAQSRLRTYYGARLTSAAFWRDLFRGRLRMLAGIRDLIAEAARATGLPRRNPQPRPLPASSDVAAAAAAFSGAIHIVLSGRDVTARGFALEYEQLDAWRPLREAGNVTVAHIADADHTCSRSAWHRELLALTVDRLQALARESRSAEQAFSGGEMAQEP